MLLGVNTNVAAMVALQNLNRSNAELFEAQRRITTGKRIESAKDNGALWGIAQGQRATLQGYNVVRDSLQRGLSVVETALGGAEQILDLLYQMRDLTMVAALNSTPNEERAILDEDFVGLRDRIASIAANTAYNNANMIKGGSTPAAAGMPVRAFVGPEGNQTITVSAENLALYHGSLNPDSLLELRFSSDISSLLRAFFMQTTLKNSIDSVLGAITRLGAGANALQSHLSLVGKIQDSVAAGIGNLVDADLAKESARYQAIQTRQRLGVEALALANSGPRLMLGLFR